MAALVGAFLHLEWYYFAILFAGGCGLMGQRSTWEKMAIIIRGRQSILGKRLTKYSSSPRQTRRGPG